MYKVLRIICSVISALCVAACIFVFIYADVIWGICVLLGAVAFFALTVLFKRYQEDEEKKQSSLPSEGEHNQTKQSENVQNDNGQN